MKQLVSAKTQLSCDNCHRPFTKYTYRIGRYNFCSRQCYSQWQVGKQKLTKRKRAKLEKQKARIGACLFCHKTFIKECSKQKFCSQECFFGHQRAIERWGPEVKRQAVCRYCSNPFVKQPSDKGIFCSLECKARWQQENRFGSNHPCWTQIDRVCQVCGKTFTVKPSQVVRGGGIFCSRKCSAEVKRQRKLAEWRDPEYRESTIRASLKGLFKRPTSLERQFISLAEREALPYKYTGDGSFLIGWKNPDFVNVNGVKVCVEVADPYFHPDPWAENRKAHFAKYGWGCYIFFSKNDKLDEQEVLSCLRNALTVVAP